MSKAGVKQVTAFKTSSGTIHETYSEATRDELDDALRDVFPDGEIPEYFSDLVEQLVKHKARLIPLIRAAV